MGKDSERRVTLERIGPLEFRVTNRKGSSMVIGGEGQDTFTPIDLLLAGIAGCTAMDVDAITGKKAQPERFDVSIRADKIKARDGNRLENIVVNFEVRFPATEEGAAAASGLHSAARRSHDRLCVVSRTVELGTPIAVRIDGAELPAVD
jgi:putative redox protein